LTSVILNLIEHFLSQLDIVVADSDLKNGIVCSQITNPLFMAWGTHLGKPAAYLDTLIPEDDLGLTPVAAILDLDDLKTFRTEFYQ
jgi:hypothetical protein